MDTFVNTVSTVDRTRGRAVVTGKSLACGGSQGREKATGQGVCLIIEQWAKDRGIKVEDLRVAVQGFGNVGYWTCAIISGMGAKVVAVHDHTGAIMNARGIDVAALRRHADATNKLGGFTGAEEVSPETFWGVDCDVLVPAAIENQITAKTGPLVRAKVVVEGANGPTTTIGERELLRRGVEIVPDILANSGGVIASFFEWLQNRASQYWHLEEVDRKLRDMLLMAYGNTARIAKDRKLDMRTAAYAVAINRLADAYRSQRRVSVGL